MTQLIDTDAAIALVRQQLERFLPREQEADLRESASHLAKALRSGVINPNGTVNQDKADQLIEAATAGDKDADMQVSAIAIWLLRNGHSLPDSFRNIEIELWRARLPKRRDIRNVGRDIQFGIAIYTLQEHGFKPTRNRAAHGGESDASESGCSIVSKALAAMGKHVPERTLEQIWEKYAHLR